MALAIVSLGAAVTRDGGSLPVSLPYDPIRVGTKKPGAGRAFKKVDQ